MKKPKQTRTMTDAKRASLERATAARKARASERKKILARAEGELSAATAKFQQQQDASQDLLYDMQKRILDEYEQKMDSKFQKYFAMHERGFEGAKQPNKVPKNSQLHQAHPYQQQIYQNDPKVPSNPREDRVLQMYRQIFGGI